MTYRNHQQEIDAINSPFPPLRTVECGPPMRKRPLLNAMLLFVLIAGVSYCFGMLSAWIVGGVW